MIHFSDREARSLGAFIEVLSAPLAFPDSIAWRREVIARGQDLLSTDRAVFGLDWDNADPVVQAGLDPAAAPAYVEYYYKFEESHDERRRTGRCVSAIHDELARGWPVNREFRHDFLSRFRLDAGAGMAHDVAHGVASWCAFYTESARAERFEERAVPILTATLPAFRAGLETLFRTRALKDDFARILDRVSDGFLLLDRDGRVLHQSSALAHMVSLGIESDSLKDHLEATRRRFAAGTEDAAQAASLFRTVRVSTGRAAYDVTPTLPGPGLADLGVALIVHVVSHAPAIHSSEGRWADFGLTARETEVARLLVQGSSYKSIAHRLGVSIDTVRSHIRRVYAKLDVHSVAEAVTRTLGERGG